MVVHNFYVFRAGICPAKADSELIVDPNAVLASAIPDQGFQSIARRHAQVLKAFGDLQLAQFPACGSFNVHVTPYALTIRECFGLRAFERDDHR